MTTSALRYFIVYVNYPNSSKEYAYLCSDYSIKQGSTCYANNGAAVVVVRTADRDHDNTATRYVTAERIVKRVIVDLAIRKRDLQKQLNQRLHQAAKMKQWAELAKTDPEAKKLLSELKGLL